jgi:AraC-like DNA-binding protein
MTNSAIPINNLLNQDSFSIVEHSGHISSTKAHYHNCHVIYFAIRGKGKMLIDNEVMDIKENSCYCIWEGQLHQMIHSEEREGYSLWFKNNFLPSVDVSTMMLFNMTLFNRIKKINELKLEEDEMEDFRTLFSNLNREFKRPRTTFGQKEYIQFLLMQLLLMLSRKSNEQKVINFAPNKSYVVSFQSFQFLLDENFSREKNIAFYANSLGISKRKLNEIIKSYSGVTFKEFLIRRYIVESKRLLSSTNSSLKEIAYMLGFKNQAYFCYSFKKETKMTPKQYRNSKKMELV